MSAPATAPVLQAIEALKSGERRRAAALLRQELQRGPASTDRWRSVSRLAAQIGEIEIAIDASERAAVSDSAERLLPHCGVLATYGRADEAVALLSRLRHDERERPSVLHFLGVVAAERGEFDEAEDHYRRALGKTPTALPTWFALAMIKTFTSDDPDLEAMQDLARDLRSASPEARARFLYALGKAYDDCGDPEKAFDCFSEGAAIRKGLEPFSPQARSALADRIIEEFTHENLRSLRPSGAGEQRSLFVTGLPRTGTTLVEQIVTSHSQVADGAETNLLRPALIPTLDYSLDGALAYQAREDGNADPWGDIGRDYLRFIDMRFRAPGLVVDKTTLLSTYMGLLLHTLPEARVVWLRRDPEDAALSCFRTYFTSAVPWSWSFEDIATQMRAEDRLFEHWRSLAPDRILVVPYEDLARDTPRWTRSILTHFGLQPETDVDTFHEQARSVQTASVRQVRSPVSTQRIGTARRYDRHLERFRAAYFEPA